MADIESIKEQLQQTSEGQLKYNDKSWNEIFDETTKSPKVHVSPFSIKNSSRISNKKKLKTDSNNFNKVYIYINFCCF